MPRIIRFPTLVIVLSLLVSTIPAVVTAQILPVYPQNGAAVGGPPTFEWTNGDSHLFGVYLYLPVFGDYLPIPLQPPAWTFGTSMYPSNPQGFEVLWGYVDYDTWALWAVLGINLSTWEYEVGGPWYFKKPASEIQVVIAGEGTGAVTHNQGPDECRVGTCTWGFTPGIDVVLTATPDAGSVFAGWGEDCAGFGLSDCTLSLDGGKTVIAAFDIDGPVGSLLNVEEIIPMYFDEATNQVDVVQDNCAAPGEEPEPEPFTDHYAEIAMTNRALNNAEEQTGSWIYLTRYEIHYTPVTQGAAPLLSSNVIPITESVGLEPCEPGSSCQEESFIAEMVPVREKAVLNQFLVENPTVFQLQYNVHYVIFGENDFGEPVSADGFTNFYATNYNNCGG